MKLITKAISNKMPELYSTDGQGDKAIIQAKEWKNPRCRVIVPAKVVFNCKSDK